MNEYTEVQFRETYYISKTQLTSGKTGIFGRMTGGHMVLENT